MAPPETIQLQELHDKIQAIAQLAQELATAGAGIPAVEKNAKAILTTTYLLGFAVSDVIDIGTE